MIGKSGIAIRNIQRAPADAVARLARFGTATISEAMGRTGLLAPYLRPIYRGARVCGPAITVFEHPGDNWMLHVAAEFLQEGDIVVLGMSSECTDGMFGELLGTSFRARGGLGLVIDAGVRDTAELAEMEFPVWAKAINAKGTIKATVGAVNTPIICAGALVNPGDNWMLHVAAEFLQKGDVVVLGMSSECTDGMFGDLLGTSFRARGGLGLVIDAGVRDTAELAEMEFPVWAKAINAKGTIKATVGAVNTPIICAGALVNPGDVIVGDDDGVVVVPAAKAADVAAAAQIREDKEAVTRARLKAGELGLDIYGMRDKLAAAGLEYP